MLCREISQCVFERVGRKWTVFSLPLVEIETSLDLATASLVVALGDEDAVLDEEQGVAALIEETAGGGASNMEEREGDEDNDLRDHDGGYSQSVLKVCEEGSGE